MKLQEQASTFNAVSTRTYCLSSLDFRIDETAKKIPAIVMQETPEQAMILRLVFLSATEKRRVVELVRQQLGKPFVLSARDDSPLYCTTLLYDAIAEVNPGFAPEWKRIDLPVFRGQYLFPKAFAQYQNTRVVWDSGNLQE